MPGGRFVRAWIDGVEFEPEAQKQVENLARLPFLAGPPCVMPDVHWGKGATIGSVFATIGAIIPAAVGVDIGCGMVARKTTLKIDQFDGLLPRIRAALEKAIPHGRTDNGGENDRGSWGSVPNFVVDTFDQELGNGFDWLKEVHPKLTHRRALNQFGTLGGGNHFCESCVDENGDVWIVIHSGSRGQGAVIGNYFIERAKRHMEQYFVTLPDANLAYLPDGTQDYNDYRKAVAWAQKFARFNREIMMQNAINALQEFFPFTSIVTEETTAVNCHHNYIAEEKHFGKMCMVTRKGAIRAGKGELGIIPGSMGAKSYIVEGLGNHESLFTASHGAGRRMSRRKARETFTVEDLARETEGVECRKDDGVLDEIPLSYKSIDAVMEAQKDLVRPIHTLKQFICIKGES